MSTSVYPTNMRRQSTGGYSNKSTLENIPYVSWKGSGIYRNPSGNSATHIRPLTNKDPGNVFQTGFGLPRPIKHYRKGRTIISNEYVNSGETKLINYNIDRRVVSSTSSSLGGGGGLISQLIDNPGSYIVKDVDNNSTENQNCDECGGVNFVSGWFPIDKLTEKPQKSSYSQTLCCNQQKNAKKRVMGANTNVSKKYYQTSGAYLQNRCQTFKQRQFNYLSEESVSEQKLYVAQCVPNNSTNACSQVYYKPNNPQFAKQGGVSSRTRTLKLMVDTINRNAYKRRLLNNNTNVPTEIQYGNEPINSYIYKDKVEKCNPSVYSKNSFYFSDQRERKNICAYSS